MLDVPDPYYADARMFDEVLGMIESASEGLFVSSNRHPAIGTPHLTSLSDASGALDPHESIRRSPLTAQLPARSSLPAQPLSPSTAATAPPSPASPITCPRPA